MTVSPPRVLTIDDEAMIRETIAAYLENRGYAVLEAANGRLGLECFLEKRPDLVLVDLRMPEMDGLEVLARIRDLSPQTPTIVVSGTGVLRDALEAIKRGAWDYVTKPILDMDVLGLAVDKALERARLLRENRAYQENLEALVRERTAEVERTRRQIMQRLSRAAEFKDNETGRHVVRVGEISALIGRAVGLSPQECDMLRECAPLHDLGKIGIPDAILLKPGPLTPGEWEIMKRHCLYGCEILGPLGSLQDARAWCSDPLPPARGADHNPLLTLARTLALLHHERWDGQGYPFGLEGEDIPLEARIVAVVDVYDALRSHRAYKKAFSERESLEILRQGAASRFDPRLVAVFFAHLEAIQAIRDKWKDEEEQAP
ncbi:MAG: HD-GYP domain-containing protein [Solidesulfovibrio sp. DCME]|uniref:HD-GYP domain-containing protein n=1 Tax=Solidesulfovibrio sp. DCME TaxID=3447380 RepID=UPI003D134C00